MTPLFILLLILLAAIETLASYISRVYAEFGKILTHEIEENLDAWEELVEPQLGLSRQHAALCAAALQQLALGVIALGLGAFLFDRAPNLARSSFAVKPGSMNMAKWSSTKTATFPRKSKKTLYRAVALCSGPSCIEKTTAYRVEQEPCMN